jgi:ubiquinol-cytochrome c reductase subunit 6
MAELSESELHHKIVDTLKKGDDPKPFVIDWCKPKCPEYEAMLTRCEQALKILKSADPEKSCIYRYRQWVECVENCVQPKIMHNLVSAHGRGKLDSFFDGIWPLRYLFAPLYPVIRLGIAMKRINIIEGNPLE